MQQIPWKHQINFSSALLLHSCITVILKESFNVLTILYRRLCLQKTKNPGALARIRGTAVLDAYTSIFSLDADGSQAEIYFTNTGALLLATSLAGSIAMNLLLSDLVLNSIVSGTFGLCFLASVLVGKNHFTLPIMALRRAGRFIWSDTPFVNFFTLIYIATVLRGQSILRLQDYVTFRCVAILELVFMKAKLAASNPEEQLRLIQQVVSSEWTVLSLPTSDDEIPIWRLPYINRHAIVAFQTLQRLSVMLFKTSVGYDNGSLQGQNGPCRCHLPPPGKCLRDEGNYLKVFRVDAQTLVISDCYNEQKTDNVSSSFIRHMHGILLRRIGRVRVVYAIEYGKGGETPLFHSNPNMVAGVPKLWLDSFMEDEPLGECIIGC